MTFPYDLKVRVADPVPRGRWSRKENEGLVCSRLYAKRCACGVPIQIQQKKKREGLCSHASDWLVSKLLLHPSEGLSTMDGLLICPVRSHTVWVALYLVWRSNKPIQLHHNAPQTYCLGLGITLHIADDPMTGRPKRISEVLLVTALGPTLISDVQERNPLC
jgi:hypothetical protein